MTDSFENLFLHLRELSNEQIASLVSELEKEEKRLSKKRKDLHAKIDSLKSYISQKFLKELNTDIEEKLLVKVAEMLSSTSRTIPIEVLSDEEETEVDIPEDYSKLDFEQLEKLFNDLRKEEAKVSYRRRVIQGKIDILKNELLARLESTFEPSDESTEDLIKRITKILSSKGF